MAQLKNIVAATDMTTDLENCIYNKTDMPTLNSLIALCRKKKSFYKIDVTLMPVDMKKTTRVPLLIVNNWIHFNQVVSKIKQPHWINSNTLWNEVKKRNLTLLKVFEQTDAIITNIKADPNLTYIDGPGLYNINEETMSINSKRSQIYEKCVRIIIDTYNNDRAPDSEIYNETLTKDLIESAVREFKTFVSDEQVHKKSEPSIEPPPKKTKSSVAAAVAAIESNKPKVIKRRKTIDERKQQPAKKRIISKAMISDHDSDNSVMSE
ncbi:PP31/39K [Operophtera brumata nucleopolyhedrovirus]|uniref:PP31/39K n=1 Tax=Operophtera brumata nucleopolyhedrovirus TaxID=1046267 RepID=A0A2H4UZR5_9ABAC|nr:PP31/39K [Operophtera brumata nucleopolyhedrovirus]AUA60259.1 PP31/39K [Operophtera brumata nucleopolyhedrovirus]